MHVKMTCHMQYPREVIFVTLSSRAAVAAVWMIGSSLYSSAFCQSSTIIKYITGMIQNSLIRLICARKNFTSLFFILWIYLKLSIMLALQSPVGFIGLGIMGKGMVRNLISKLDPSLSFVVWNRSADACQELITQFPDRVTSVATPAEVVRQCQTTFSMLSTIEASVDVVSFK